MAESVKHLLGLETALLKPEGGFPEASLRKPQGVRGCFTCRIEWSHRETLYMQRVLVPKRWKMLTPKMTYLYRCSGVPLSDIKDCFFKSSCGFHGLVVAPFSFVLRFLSCKMSITNPACACQLAG